MEATTAATRFGIGNFVYAARRPFMPERLAQVAALLPTEEGQGAMSNALGMSGAAAGSADGEGAEVDSELKAALSGVVRSKGFLWLAQSSTAAMYVGCTTTIITTTNTNTNTAATAATPHTRNRSPHPAALLF